MPPSKHIVLNNMPFFCCGRRKFFNLMFCRVSSLKKMMQFFRLVIIK
jgi:hypothetical protein